MIGVPFIFALQGERFVYLGHGLGHDRVALLRMLRQKQHFFQFKATSERR